MPLSRRQIYRRRRVAVFGSIALVLVVAFYLPSTLLAPIKAQAAVVLPYTAPTSTAAKPTWPTYGASAIGAIGFDGVLAASGSTAQLPMASISKIITALVVLDAKPLAVDESGPTITFSSSDEALYHQYLKLNGSIEPVRSGLSLTELQVLQLMLIPSANNYAASLVNWAYGSESAFVPVAQTWLKVHGLTNTTFVEPTGIDPTNTSTASDLVAIGKIAIANPTIAKIVATKSVKIPGVRTVENTNQLLGVSGVSGMKTGTLDKFGANLLFTANYVLGTTTIVIVGVVLGGKTHPIIDAAILKLLATATAGFHDVALTIKGTPFASYTSPWGASTQLVAATSQSIVVWGDTPVTLSATAPPLALGREGEEHGSLHFTAGTRAIDVQLILSKSISDPGPSWRLTHPIGLY